METEAMLMVGDVELCVETFGDADDPALLLIGGAGSSMDWWDPGLCERLAAGRRFVIRYDQRDTGRSTTFPAGEAVYTMPDLEADAVGVLDVLGLRTAHLVGMSLGGVIALRLAIDHPDRVASLALLSSSPGGPDLPPKADELQAYFDTEPFPPDWSDRSAIVDASESIRSRLDEVRAPALVIHGTADPVYPLGHAETLARELPDAQLLPLDGVGHQMPPPQLWRTVAAALLRHTSGGWRAQEDRLASRSLADGDAVGWFDQLYTAGATGALDLGPWARDKPLPALVEWTRARELSGHGHRAVVVGCGLGADAEHVAGLGYATVAFDISETAVRMARERNPDSRVDYLTSDLRELPDEWLGAFDLVVEIITVQALPEPLRSSAILDIGSLTAPAGTLIVIANRRDDTEPTRELPPWPLTRSEIDAFTANGLQPVIVEALTEPDGRRWWRAELRYPD